MKIPARVQRVIWGFALLALTACPSPTNEGVTLRQLAHAYVAATGQCDIINSAFFKEYEPNYVNDSYKSFDYVLAELEAQENHPAYRVDQQALNECYEIVSRNTASCSGIGAGPPCTDIFVGVIDEGDVCGAWDQCIAGLSCKQDGNCGTCVPVLGEGDSCEAEITGVCNPDAEMFCESDTEICVVNEPNEVIEFAAGDTCGPGGCQYWMLSGLACVDSICVEMEVVEEGESCDFDAIFGNATRICQGSIFSRELFCEVTEANASVGICTKTRALREACRFDGDCQAGLSCRSGEYCVEVSPECRVDTDCDGYCERGKCIAVFQEVEPRCF